MEKIQAVTEKEKTTEQTKNKQTNTPYTWGMEVSNPYRAEEKFSFLSHGQLEVF